MIWIATLASLVRNDDFFGLPRFDFVKSRNDEIRRISQPLH
ncbi:hypothetical protein ACWIUD_03720 [Helicobacter sp. 23-1044]